MIVTGSDAGDHHRTGRRGQHRRSGRTGDPRGHGFQRRLAYRNRSGVGRCHFGQSGEEVVGRLQLGDPPVRFGGGGLESHRSVLDVEQYPPDLADCEYENLIEHGGTDRRDN
jgi:hypothetical protein